MYLSSCGVRHGQAAPAKYPYANRNIVIILDFDWIDKCHRVEKDDPTDPDRSFAAGRILFIESPEMVRITAALQARSRRVVHLTFAPAGVIICNDVLRFYF